MYVNTNIYIYTYVHIFTYKYPLIHTHQVGELFDTTKPSGELLALIFFAMTYAPGRYIYEYFVYIYVYVFICIYLSYMHIYTYIHIYIYTGLPIMMPLVYI
jgi:hypothetical protein